MASRRRNAGVRSGAIKAGAEVVVTAGRGARASSATPAASVSANTMLVTDKPATEGNTLATSTPKSARPSRQETMRARWPSSPPSRAPQAWCSTLSTL